MLLIIPPEGTAVNDVIGAKCTGEKKQLAVEVIILLEQKQLTKLGTGMEKDKQH